MEKNLIVKDEEPDQALVSLAKDLNSYLAGRTIASVEAGNTAGWVYVRFTNGSAITIWVGKDAAPDYPDVYGHHQHTIAFFCECGSHGSNFPNVDAVPYSDDEAEA